MSNKLSLDGVWQLNGINPNSGNNIEIDAVVPGHVHLDLLRKNIILDPFWRDQAEKCQWIEDWTWIYSKEFVVEDTFLSEWCELEFNGLDTYAEILLNGQKIGDTSNMFIPHNFDVSDVLFVGKNSLEIIFKPYKKFLDGKRLDYKAAFANAERLHVRRMQCTFFWDWVNRFVSYGIWRPVLINSFSEAKISDLFIYTHSIDKSSASIMIELSCEIKSNEYVWANVELTSPNKEVVWHERLRISNSTTFLQADLQNPKLWWPNGYGEQPIYDCTVVIENNEGNIFDSIKKSFGIRTIRLEKLKDLPNSDEFNQTLKLREQIGDFEKNGENPGESFTLLVNGERIFCKGGNWVPADPFPSRITNEWYDRLIYLAKEGNINLLRCWGGGIYEPKEFWDACDKYGIMVSQDFQFACGQYPEDDHDFMNKIKKEIPEVIQMLRSYTSLVWWTGDNENAMKFDFDDTNRWGNKITEDIIRPNLRRMDPSRPFCTSSPFGGRDNRSLTIGDSHFAAWKIMNIDENQMENYLLKVNDLVGRFMSESTSMGSPSKKQLLKFMTEEDIAATDKYIWEYHTKDNPHKPNGASTLFGYQELMAEKLLGESKTIDDKVKKLGYVQYEWIRVTMEAARRKKWYCSGLQYWMYNDCWPATGWSIVDYYGYPKAGWYAFKRASKPVIASICKNKDDYYIYVCNDRLIKASGNMRLFVQPWEGVATWEKHQKFNVQENESAIIFKLHKDEIVKYLDKNSMLICEITGDFEMDRAYYFNGMPYEIDPPKVLLNVNIESYGNKGIVKINSKSFARVVYLEGNVIFSDNYFDLLPGEEKVVEWDLFEDKKEDIVVGGWNEIITNFKV